MSAPVPVQVYSAEWWEQRGDRGRCKGRVRRANRRCLRPAYRGMEVCGNHGGRAPQVKRAAERRLAAQAAAEQARAMVERAGVDADPLEHLLDSLYYAAAQVAIWDARIAALDAVADLEAAEGSSGLRGELGYRRAASDSQHELAVASKDRLIALDRHGAAQLHPFVAERNYWAKERRACAKLCLDANVGERTVKVKEGEALRFVAAAKAAVQDADAALSPAVQQRVLGALAKHLRLLPAGSV